MIPILYNRDETRFVTNGIGRLSDCTRFVVTEERNGIYEAEFDYPITGVHFDEISLGKIVACTHDDKHDIQPFVIYSRSVPDLNGIVTFNAHHISYRLNDVVVMPYTAGSVAAALNGISTNSVNSNPFTFWTDKTTTADFTNEVPRNARNMLGGEENSILDVFGGGDYEFDKFTVKLYAHRGQDSDVEIRYSKNLTNLSQTIDDGESYNAVVPYWMGSEGELVTLPEKMLVFSGTEPQIAYLTDHNLIIIRTETDEPIEVAYTIADAAPMDLSDVFEEQPTVEQLRNAAIARFESSDAWLPNENLTVDFVQLWQTEEFEEYSALQRVSLCDTVSVYYPQVGISEVKQRVVKVVYDVLMDRYDSIELGQIQTSLGQAIQTQIMENVPTTSMMDAAIQYATDLIRGGLGGYVVMTPGANGYPQEILIMDTPDVDTAVNVWRFNQGGLGHSHSGYQGPFDDIALTQDGRINANMITTGVLNANLITAGTMSADRVRGGTLIAGGSEQGLIEVRNASDAILTQMNQYGIVTNSVSATSGYYYGSVLRNYSLGFIRNETRDFADSTLLANPDAELRYYRGSIDPSQSGSANIPLLSLTNGNGNVSVNSASGGSIKIYNETVTDYVTNHDCQLVIIGDVVVRGKLHARSTLSTGGTKPRDVKTNNYSNRYLYCYETPTPLFGDIGEAQLDSDGICYVDVDDIFSETIETRQEYQVFLQKEGEGDCWIAEKQKRYFVIKGTPNLKVAWELKAKQRDYDMIRLEQPENGLDEYEHTTDADSLLDSYINEQEELLYG